MKTFIINISGDGDELEYYDRIEGESVDAVLTALQEIANERREALHVCEEGTDRWEEVDPEP